MNEMVARQVPKRWCETRKRLEAMNPLQIKAFPLTEIYNVQTMIRRIRYVNGHAFKTKLNRKANTVTVTRTE